MDQADPLYHELFTASCTLCSNGLYVELFIITILTTVIAIASCTGTPFAVQEVLDALDGLDDDQNGSPLAAMSADEIVGIPTIELVQRMSSRCTICLESLERGERVRILPCLHRYHIQCIDSWLSIKANCPMCKIQV